jgi:hypothetical protein
VFFRMFWSALISISITYPLSSWLFGYSKLWIILLFLSAWRCPRNREFPVHDWLFWDHQMVLERVVAKIDLLTRSFGLNNELGEPLDISPMSHKWHAFFAYSWRSAGWSEISVKMHFLDVSGFLHITFILYSEIIFASCAFVIAQVRFAFLSDFALVIPLW